jgi:hypothetical protein
MKTLIVIALVLLALAVGAEAATNQLDWTDNSDNEALFHVERKAVACATEGAYIEIGTVGPNVTTYLDQTVTEGTAYCYRVKASNAAGHSAYSNEAGRTPPLTVPAAPSNLVVQ